MTSGRRTPRLAALVVALTALAFAPARAGVIDPMEGHLSVGYAKLVVEDAPGGSLSLAGGVDFPVVTGLRAGLSLGYHLLGSRTIERGSLIAALDYSALDVSLLAHWLPSGLGPVARLSAGPALMVARAELSTAGGGAAFADLAVQETVPGFGVEATLMRRSPSPVRLGFELGARVGYVEKETWTVITARATFHY